jgi:hypothetical protein
MEKDQAAIFIALLLHLHSAAEGSSMFVPTMDLQDLSLDYGQAECSVHWRSQDFDTCLPFLLSDSGRYHGPTTVSAPGSRTASLLHDKSAFWMIHSHNASMSICYGSLKCTNHMRCWSTLRWTFPGMFGDTM